MFKIYIDDVLVKSTRSKYVMFRTIGEWYFNSWGCTEFTKIVVKRKSNVVFVSWNF